VTFMAFAIFTRSNMVVNPGWAQILDTLLVTVATCGITCAIFGTFVKDARANLTGRTVLALASFVVMLHPDGNVALATAAFVLPATIYGVARHRRIAPQSKLQVDPVISPAPTP
jgi:hypothetical protein